ncbi:hypothetical protein PsorP6_015069 [Peronosclerospora sorghi]|uniref:Uncharacterized protein n=1 Tax=Peronosclerospora sorghi TaxID=230839 RepID=A0ACC0VT15_9STRA|nr:hypothetical protein PsorP6_015069 [Peronosclerospora sorghi]
MKEKLDEGQKEIGAFRAAAELPQGSVVASCGEVVWIFPRDQGKSMIMAMMEIVSKRTKRIDVVQAFNYWISQRRAIQLIGGIDLCCGIATLWISDTFCHLFDPSSAHGIRSVINPGSIGHILSIDPSNIVV